MKKDTCQLPLDVDSFFPEADGTLTVAGRDWMSTYCQGEVTAAFGTTQLPALDEGIFVDVYIWKENDIFRKAYTFEFSSQRGGELSSGLINKMLDSSTYNPEYELILDSFNAAQAAAGCTL